ncbi:uncharacterized protein [Lepisosteus oculatus]|uniref:uncharacterized protein isoform X4 n=1 Tax=Lepisosteus oculatus TaxID=7918 RepID=UPI000740081D|nr:PREDICTED: uncharacterized protein LOC107079255 isoform X5 [Lepisosteus oculatus]
MAVCFLLALCCVLRAGGVPPHVAAQSQAVGYLGQNVTLSCSLRAAEQPMTVVQLSWERGGRAVAVFNPIFGTSYPTGDWGGRLLLWNRSGGLWETSLSIARSRLGDSGNYSCIFTIFPDGTLQEQVSLTIEELVEIPVTRPLSLDCLDPDWSTTRTWAWNTSSHRTVLWYRLGPAGSDRELVLEVQFEGSSTWCRGDLLAHITGCTMELVPNGTRGSRRYEHPMWTPSPAQAGRYRCEWTNGTYLFHRTFHLKVKAGQQPIRYRIDVTQTRQIVYSTIWVSPPLVPEATEADRREEDPVYVNLVHRNAEQAVYSEVRTGAQREGDQ